MNSWAKIMSKATEEGFDFWGFFHEMKVYKNGKYLGTVRNFRQLKKMIGDNI